MKNRISPRLQGYDYGKNGTYFVTICTKNREPYFGEVIDGKMKLSEIGEICNKEILNTNNMRNNISIDQYIIMPDHIHLIAIIDRNVGTDCIYPNKNNPKRTHAMRPYMKTQTIFDYKKTTLAV